MALKKCRACNREVDTSAPTCPHCGARHPTGKRTSVAAMGCLTLIVLGLLTALLPDSPETDRNGGDGLSPEHRAQREANQLAANTVLRGLSTTGLRAASRDSLQLVSTWADSMLAPEVYTAVKAELSRRGPVTEQEIINNRVADVQAQTSRFRFDDGSRCTKATPARIRRIVTANLRWTTDVLARVSCGSVWIGMTAAQLRASMGEPRKINRTVTASGTHEQWVYGDFGPYFYVVEGILTSWQD